MLSIDAERELYLRAEELGKYMRNPETKRVHDRLVRSAKVSEGARISISRSSLVLKYPSPETRFGLEKITFKYRPTKPLRELVLPREEVVTSDFHTYFMELIKMSDEVRLPFKTRTWFYMGEPSEWVKVLRHHPYEREFGFGIITSKDYQEIGFAFGQIYAGIKSIRH